MTLLQVVSTETLKQANSVHPAIAVAGIVMGGLVIIAFILSTCTSFFDRR